MTQKDDLIIRRALPWEREDFVALFLLSAPFFAELCGGGKRSIKVLSSLFTQKTNLFSFEHTTFAEKGKVIVGMTLGYPWQARRKEQVRTGFLLLEQLGLRFFINPRWWHNLNAATGALYPEGYYLSNLAVYPNYQGQGIGKKLLEAVEEKAREEKLSCVELDVEKANQKALHLYQSLGYQGVRESRLNFQGRNLILLRMIKKVG